MIVHPPPGRGRAARFSRRGARAVTAAAGTLLLLIAPLVTSCSASDSTSSTVASTSAAPKGSAPSPTETLLPKSTSSAAVGTLAAGFPTDLLPIPDDAELLVSAADPVPDSSDVQISLNLRTNLTAAELLALYRAPLTAAGFSEVPADTTSSALAGQATFTRSAGDEILVLGVLDRDDVRTLTLGGRVRTSG